MTIPPLIDWAIQQDAETGAWHAGSDTPLGASVMDGGRLFMRRAAQPNGEIGEFSRWLVLELDGVRCYVVSRGGRVHLLMTREDLYPDAGAATG